MRGVPRGLCHNNRQCLPDHSVVNNGLATDRAAFRDASRHRSRLSLSEPWTAVRRRIATIVSGDVERPQHALSPTGGDARLMRDPTSFRLTGAGACTPVAALLCWLTFAGPRCRFHRSALRTTACVSRVPFCALQFPTGWRKSSEGQG